MRLQRDIRRGCAGGLWNSSAAAVRLRGGVCLSVALLLVAAASLLAGCRAQRAAVEGEASPAAASPDRERPPNIIVIMADDLGYNELGSYGQDKIKTPHLDRMAEQGIRFTQFYRGSPVCAPSRATLLTGRHTGHTYVRDNYGLGGFADDDERGQLALPAGTPTLAAMLQDAGYATGAVGLPSEHGFDFFYGYLDQKQAHNYYPTHLWRVTPEKGAVWDTLRNEYFKPHAELDEFPEDPGIYDRFKGEEYAPALMHEEAQQFIRTHQDEPFFLYRAPIIPHTALQVPDSALAAYDFEETPYLGQEKYLPHPRPLAAYAAMISWMDRQVGETLALLEELGISENTLVIFTSDNGTTYVDGVRADFFDSVEPLRGLKGSVYEGGIRVPMIARWPGRIPAGQVSDRVGALWDFLPTFADLADADAPGEIDGTSLWPALQGEASDPADGSEGAFGERPPLYWEYYGLCEGQQAVRLDRWKAVRLGISTDGGAPTPIDRWHMEEMQDRPRLADGTPPHACLPWIEEERTASQRKKAQPSNP